MRERTIKQGTELNLEGVKDEGKTGLNELNSGPFIMNVRTMEEAYMENGVLDPRISEVSVKIRKNNNVQGHLHGSVFARRVRVIISVLSSL